MKNGHYEEILPDENGRLECREIGLWLGLWQGEHLWVNETWLRFYTVDGQLVPKFAEAEAQRANAAEEEIKRLHALLIEKG